ncbi:glycyl-radical enzyme activating protein [Chloroflexota bacterium]
MAKKTTLRSAPSQGTGCRDKIEGVVTNIQSYSLHDGAGIRTLVFLKGCPIRCRWCCNPEGQDPQIEVEFFGSKCVKCGACLQVCKQKAINPDLDLKSGFKINRDLCNKCGDCVNACPKEALKFSGEVTTVDKILKEIKKDKYYFLLSKGGLTLSGGESLDQFEFAYELLKESYNNNIDTAIETCGHVPWEHFAKVLPYLDSVLYDIKHMDPVKHKQWTGVSNRLILSNLKKLSKSGVPIIIRLPLIPGFNTDDDNIKKTAEFISGLENVKEVNLLPFHQLGKDKYYRLSKKYSLKNERALDSYAEGTEKIRKIKRLFDSCGIKATVG